MTGMGFPKNSKFYEIFDKKFQQLFQSGIIDYYASEWFQYSNVKRYEHLHYDEPQVLTIDDLEACMLVWLISIAIAAAVFVLEWVVNIFGYFVVRSVFAAFYDIQREVISFDKNMKIFSTKNLNDLRLFQEKIIHETFV